MKETIVLKKTPQPTVISLPNDRVFLARYERTRDEIYQRI